ncbi:rRNA pseudouridine synthase [Candidatus Woesebacteria bacterium]|nr:rRNA pseudouridine synthase [Candidatus Woesebacteria bacterium]
MRLHKFMANCGIASRRKSEVLIQDGLVTVNGKRAGIGQVIDTTLDQVVVRGQKLHAPAGHVYYLVNKPRQVVSTTSDPDGRRTVTSLVKSKKRLYPVGRLDYDSEGLMLLTDDGELAQKLTHPKYETNKTYRVLVKGNITAKAVKYLESGVVIEGKKTAPAIVEIVEKQPNNTWIDITIHEGRNRQIRKMCEAVSYPVIQLIRTKLGEWELGDLKPGEARQINIDS